MAPRTSRPIGWATVTPQRPQDPEALQQLHAAFQEAVAAGYGHAPTPWTREVSLALGRLYVSAWGCLPTPARMTTDYGLPSRDIVLRLWGSYAAYYAALEVL